MAWRREQLVRGAELEDAALHEDTHPIGQRCRILEVMGDENRRQSELVKQLFELRPHVCLRMGIERRERLIEQEDRRIPSERACQGDPLALPAGKLSRARLGQMADTEPLEELALATASGVGDVLLDRHVGEQGVLLEHEPDSASLRRKIDSTLSVEQHLLANPDAASLWSHESSHRAEHSSLSRP